MESTKMSKIYENMLSDEEDDSPNDELETKIGTGNNEESDQEMLDDSDNDDDEKPTDEAEQSEEDDEEDDYNSLNNEFNEQTDVTEIEFDPTKHIQHLTLNEMTRIIININDMVNNNVLQIPASMSKAAYIYDTIVKDTFDIVIRRPIDITTCIRVNLNQLKIDQIKLKQKLERLFG